MADSRTYFEKLKDVNWQKKRLEILQRDDWRCQLCFGYMPSETNTLHVHHKYYRKGADPWDYPDEALITLCEPCHAVYTEDMTQAAYALMHAFQSAMFAPDEMQSLADAINQKVFDEPPPAFIELLCLFFYGPHSPRQDESGLPRLFDCEVS